MVEWFARVMSGACLLAYAGAAQAAVPATYVFFGQVATATNPGALPVGTIVPISVTVDTAFPADSQIDHVTTYFGGGAYYNGLPSPILAVQVNGQDALGALNKITITTGRDGAYGIDIYSSLPEGTVLALHFATTMKGVVRGFEIPKHVFPGNFQTAVFSFSGYAHQNMGPVITGPIVE